MFPPPLRGRSHYYCTPVNSITFAEAAGDGVHYGFLTVRPGDLTDCPVVKTTPGYGGEDDNHIVGDNLYEFLCLGCRSGYDLVPEYADDSLYEMTLADIEADPDKANKQWAYVLAEQRRRILEFLTARLDLRPWPNVKQRLTELHEQYYGLIELPKNPGPF